MPLLHQIFIQLWCLFSQFKNKINSFLGTVNSNIGFVFFCDSEHFVTAAPPRCNNTRTGRIWGVMRLWNTKITEKSLFREKVVFLWKSHFFEKITQKVTFPRKSHFFTKKQLLHKNSFPGPRSGTPDTEKVTFLWESDYSVEKSLFGEKVIFSWKSHFFVIKVIFSWF